MEPVIIAVAVLVLLSLGMIALFAKFYHKVEQGYAMIVNTLRAEPEVTFTGRMVYPIIHKAELMEISLKTIEIDRSGSEGLICQDNIRADIKVKFFVRVNKTAEDVLKVAQGIGCDRASSPEILEDLFSAKFSEALKTVGKAMDFIELYQARDRFRDEIVRQIGDDLSGYVLEDAAIDYLEQTPLQKLDTHNILDAQGIKKITELTAVERVRTNELRRNEEMQIKKKDVETQEALLELERQQADAQSRQLLDDVPAQPAAADDGNMAAEDAQLLSHGEHVAVPLVARGKQPGLQRQPLHLADAQAEMGGGERLVPPRQQVPFRLFAQEIAYLFHGYPPPTRGKMDRVSPSCNCWFSSTWRWFMRVAPISSGGRFNSFSTSPTVVPGWYSLVISPKRPIRNVANSLTVTFMLVAPFRIKSVYRHDYVS